MPRDSCWSVPVRAGVVVVMGTQYIRVEGQGEKADRQVREYSLPEIMYMQGRAVRHAQPGRFHLFCQAESKETLTRFLNEGLPLESGLLENGAYENVAEGPLEGRRDFGQQQQTADFGHFVMDVPCETDCEQPDVL